MCTEEKLKSLSISLVNRHIAAVYEWGKEFAQGTGTGSAKVYGSAMEF